MTPFLENGILGREHGFLIPVTSEDPSLTVYETKPTSNKWGILIFWGNPDNEECIGIINDENYMHVHKSVKLMPVTNREGKCLGSIWNRIDNRLKTKNSNI